MKLKTLKNIAYDCGDSKLVREIELKQEAIKWIKTFKKHAQPKLSYYFKLFFNITEDDLKETTENST